VCVCVCGLFVRFVYCVCVFGERILVCWAHEARWPGRSPSWAARELQLTKARHAKEWHTATRRAFARRSPQGSSLATTPTIAAVARQTATRSTAATPSNHGCANQSPVRLERRVNDASTLPRHANDTTTCERHCFSSRRHVRRSDDKFLVLRRRGEPRAPLDAIFVPRPALSKRTLAGPSAL